MCNETEFGVRWEGILNGICVSYVEESILTLSKLLIEFQVVACLLSNWGSKRRCIKLENRLWKGQPILSK